MQLQTVLHRRRMVRAYDPQRPVPAEVRDRLLSNAARAPSAGHSQGWAFLVLEQVTDRDRFWSALAPTGPADPWLRGMRTAPLLIVPLAHRAAYLDRYAEQDKGWTDRDERRWPVPYWYVDTGFAALIMLLTAVDAELGACFFGIPADRIDAFHDTFGVPLDHTPIGVVSVGYPAEGGAAGSAARGRRDLSEIVHTGHW